MQTARIIEFPTNLKESIKLALREAPDISNRQSMNTYIKQILKLHRLKEITITDHFKLQIYLKKDGELLYDVLNHDAVSRDGNCPVCDHHFAAGSTILYIHPGLYHDKAVFACNCGSFYAYYARKEE